MTKHKTAWLVGIYTYEMDLRIEALGYSITKNIPPDGCLSVSDDMPDLVVIAEDPITESMPFDLVKEMVPDTLVISLPSVFYNSMNPSFQRGPEQSIARLVHKIQERFLRWDN